MWNSISSELNIPNETSTSDESTSGLDGGITTPLISAKGSRLRRKSKGEKRIVNSLSEALDTMVAEKIILVVDDFHYLKPMIAPRL